MGLCTCLQTKRNCTGNPWIRRTFSPLFPYDREIYGCWVAADDHVGHGKTAMYNNTWGDWGDAGFHTMMEDEHKLKEIVNEMYPDLPYFLFGHSMGSFITRDFAAKYGEDLAGITICGTTGHFRGATEAETALLLKEKEKSLILPLQLI
jgi:alpha-beta hydrolase superfamily lysophospholipase